MRPTASSKRTVFTGTFTFSPTSLKWKRQQNKQMRCICLFCCLFNIKHRGVVRRGLLRLMTGTRVKSNAVARWISENAEPASVGDFCFGDQRLATERLNPGKRSVDVVGRDVNEYFASLVSRVFTHLDKTTTRTGICLEHVVVECLVDLNVPAKEIRVELPCICRVVCRNFDVDDGMICHKTSSFLFVALN